MKITETDIGLKTFAFMDLNGRRCNIQESSLATDDGIWLGVEGHARILLSKKQACIVATHLINFSITGEL